MTECHVYRLYDDAGQILYVGCTRTLKKRVQQHRRRQPWADRIARVEHESFPDGHAALIRERRLIADLAPPFNRKRGAATHPPLPGVADMTPADLRTLLIEGGYTQRWLARQLGMSPTTVNGWATGRMEIPAVRAAAIAALLSPRCPVCGAER